MGSFSAPARRGRRRSGGEAQPLTCGVGRVGATQAACSPAKEPGRAQIPHTAKPAASPPRGRENPRGAALCFDREAQRRRGER